VQQVQRAELRDGAAERVSCGAAREGARRAATGRHLRESRALWPRGRQGLCSRMALEPCHSQSDVLRGTGLTREADNM